MSVIGIFFSNGMTVITLGGGSCGSRHGFALGWVAAWVAVGAVIVSSSLTLKVITLGGICGSRHGFALGWVAAWVIVHCQTG